MDEEKEKYVRRFFKRKTSKGREEVFLAFIETQEQKIRDCYSESCCLRSHEYVRMILRDAVFIIELLIRDFEEHESDFLVKTPAEILALQLDLLLLENQLPYFLLEGLYRLGSIGPPFIKLCLEFFSVQMFSQPEPKQNEFKHFTQLQRAALADNFLKAAECANENGQVDKIKLTFATEQQESGVKVASCPKFFSFQMFSQRASKQKRFKHVTDVQTAAPTENLPIDGESATRNDQVDISKLACATELQESGVKFRCASEKVPLLVIKFEKGELRIPQLSVFHETDTMLRNIMAFEQCCFPHYPLVVCAYVQFLDSLIEDKRHAQLLVDKGIICNWLGDSKALANLFNKLCVEIPLVENHYAELYKALNDYHENPYNRNKARLKNVYFGDIWKGTATVAAAIILILTFIQNIYTVKQQMY